MALHVHCVTNDILDRLHNVIFHQFKYHKRCKWGTWESLRIHGRQETRCGIPNAFRDKRRPAHAPVEFGHTIFCRWNSMVTHFIDKILHWWPGDARKIISGSYEVTDLLPQTPTQNGWQVFPESLQKEQKLQRSSGIQPGLLSALSQHSRFFTRRIPLVLMHVE